MSRNSGQTPTDDSPDIQDGQNLINRRRSCIKNMYKAINSMAAAGKRWSELQRDHRIALARKTAELRDKGMPAALVSTMAKGSPEIAALEQQMEVAAVEREQYSELTLAYKADANLTESQIAREWGKTK